MSPPVRPRRCVTTIPVVHHELLMPSLRLKRVTASLLLVFSAAFMLFSTPLYLKSAEGATDNLARWPADGAFAVEELKEHGDGKGTGGAVAEKVLGFVSKVVGEVGNDVKNSVLYGMSKLRTSEKYKKAKYLVNAPSVDTKWVSARLQKWGTVILRFVNAYACMSPETRAGVLKLYVGENANVASVIRKYAHIGEVPDADCCYKSFLGLRAALEETIERLKARMVVQQGQHRLAPGSADIYELLPRDFTPARHSFKRGDNQPIHGEGFSWDTATDSHIRGAGNLIQSVIKQQARLLFYLVHPFANGRTLANELSFYLSKMLPVAKEVFALTWRLNSVLPANLALSNKRMLADYLEDALDFEEGLRAVLERREGYPCEYNPHIDYYFISPPPASALDIPPLSDTL